MKNRTAILFWLLGGTILFAALYFFILRYPGYIFYFDSSGSFNYNRPFDQYLFTYTPYDGIEVGIKNRLPIISIIASLYYLTKPILALSSQDVIKIAFVLLFLGAYTAFYLVLPRFYALLWRTKVSAPLFTSIQGNLLRVFFSLLYLMVPFFIFRLTMLHMFYFTTFYPLITYVFLQLCDKKIFSWRSILLLTILCFFGFSYTNIIFYYLLTFLLFAGAAFFSKKHSSEKNALIGNLLVAGILIIVTNIYWIAPYFLKDRPEPGYVVTTMMVNALGEKSTFQNVLLDTSEWFVGQGEKVVVFLDQNKMLLAVQLLGAINVYLFSIFALSASKRKSYTFVIIFLILVSFFATVRGSPLYEYLYNTVVYYDFGWLIREPNRQRVFIAFWTFLLFALGIINLTKRGENEDDHKDTYIKFSAIVALITYIVYVTPWSYNSLVFLKPAQINTDLAKIDSVLASSNGYSYVNTVPSLELYRSSWIERKYDIADMWNYRLNYYSLPRPSLHLNTVVPVARTKESMLSEMLFWQDNTDNTTSLFRYLGVEYTLFDKQAVPIFTSKLDNEQYYVNPIKKALSDEKNWETEYSGDTYLLSKSKNYLKQDSLSLTRETLVTAEPLRIVAQLSTTSLAGKDIKFMSKDVIELAPQDKILVYEGDKNFALDYLSTKDRNQYVTYPFDYTKKYEIPVDWGRASSQDKGGAEFTSVLRYHGIRAYQFLADDKVAYSDLEGENSVTNKSLKYTLTTPCREHCSVYAKVMYSFKGGSLLVSAGNVFQSITTKSLEREGFYWEQIAVDQSFTQSQIEISLVSMGGVNAVGGIAVLPDSVVASTQSELATRTIYKVAEKSEENVLPDTDPRCTLDNLKYNESIIPHVVVDGFCDVRTDMRLKQFQSEFLYVDKQTGKMQFANSIPVVEGFQGEIWFFSRVDVVLWVLFALTFVAIVIFAELILLKHVV